MPDDDLTSPEDLPAQPPPPDRHSVTLPDFVIPDPTVPDIRAPDPPPDTERRG